MPTLTLRQWHSYIALFAAPSVIFFALTGALQLFSLHEAHGSYRPAVLIASLSGLHRDQVLAPHEHEEDEQAEDDHPQARNDDDDEPAPATLALKIYFCIVAVGLVVSASFGIWIGVVQLRRKGLAWMLLGLGTLVPVALLLA